MLGVLIRCVCCAHRPTERERTERLIKTRLREIMMQKDLENVTSKEVGGRHTDTRTAHTHGGASLLPSPELDIYHGHERKPGFLDGLVCTWKTQCHHSMRC